MEKSLGAAPLPLRVLGTVLSHPSLAQLCVVFCFWLDLEQRRRGAASALPGFPNVSQLHSQSLQDILSSTFRAFPRPLIFSLALNWGCCCWEGLWEQQGWISWGKSPLTAGRSWFISITWVLLAEKCMKILKSRVRQGHLWERLTWINLLLFRMIFGA